MGEWVRGSLRSLAGLAVVTLAAVLAGAAAGEGTTGVSLSVVGSRSANVSMAKGKPVGLVARAAMRPGDRLLIGVTRGRESTLRRVALCSRSPCTGRWTERSAISDRFQAFVTRGSGKPFAIVGTSGIVRVTWKAPASPPPPPPPAPPVATPGHYEGRSSFNEAFAFDVSADGKSVLNLRTGQVNESCSPSSFTLSGGNLSAPGPYSIAADGSFTISSSFSIAVSFSDGSVATGPRKVAITGRFTSGAATGTIRTDTSLSWKDADYSCSSGDQTWTASKV
jgi:hypothetical protein